jgi:hypothetical protein
MDPTEFGPDRKKIQLFQVEKILPIKPTGQVGPNVFMQGSGLAGCLHNLHYKIAKNVYQAEFGSKIFLSGYKFSVQALSIKVRGGPKPVGLGSGRASFAV